MGNEICLLEGLSRTKLSLYSFLFGVVSWMALSKKKLPVMGLSFVFFIGLLSYVFYESSTTEINTTHFLIIMVAPVLIYLGTSYFLAKREKYKKDPNRIVHLFFIILFSFQLADLLFFFKWNSFGYNQASP